MNIKMGTWTIIGALVAIVALLFTITSYLISSLDKKMEEKISDPNFIKQLAKEIRLPFLIFDENNVVLSDVGGYELLESFEIIKNEKGDISEIRITPKSYLATAPILEIIGTNMNFLEPKRIENISWLFEVDTGYGGFLVTESYKDPIRKFRLTIIK